MTDSNMKYGPKLLGIICMGVSWIGFFILGVFFSIWFLPNPPWYTNLLSTRNVVWLNNGLMLGEDNQLCAVKNALGFEIDGGKTMIITNDMKTGTCRPAEFVRGDRERVLEDFGLTQRPVR